MDRTLDRPGACAAGLGLALLLAATGACGGHPDHGPEPAKKRVDSRPERGGGPIRTSMEDVVLRVDEAVSLEVRGLYGSLEPTREGRIPVFDDPASFRIAIEGAEVAMTPASMAALLNRYVFDYDGAPLSDIELEITDDGRVRQTARLAKAGGVEVSILGSLSATDDGDVRLHPDEMHAEGVPVKGLMDLLGVETAELLDVKEAHGVWLDGDDILLDPERIVPPPRIRGAVTAVRVEDGAIVQVFGAGWKRGAGPRPPVADRGYLFFTGGTLRFGKLTMTDTDLEIADADPSDPFHFFQRRYERQLVAGYSKTLEDDGLVSFMPDDDDLEPKAATP